MTISETVLDVALGDLFDFSPVPFCISTIDHEARYLKVNPAYGRLVGRDWQSLKGESISLDLPYSLDDPARLHRMHLLDTVGFYELAEIEMCDVNGRIIPVLISAQRRRIDGESLDIEIIIDNSERKAFERAILDSASTDHLTGLPNRRAFDKRLVSSLAEKPDDRCVALIFIDLNGFKSVNDHYGHAAGDMLLRIVGERLRNVIGRSDFTARLGGDEFAIILETPLDRLPTKADITGLAARIVDNIRIDEIAMPVGAAIGVSIADSRVTADALLDHADRLMYIAKASGKRIDIALAPFSGTRYVVTAQSRS